MHEHTDMEWGIRQNKMLTTGTSNIGYAGVLCTDVILETFS